MIRYLPALLALCAVSASAATDVGIFSNARVYDATLNVETGANLTTLKGIWTSRGAVFHQIGTITPEFLSTVTVFYTSKINNTLFTTAEATAMRDWIVAGGTLVVTGECG